MRAFFSVVSLALVACSTSNAPVLDHLAGSDGEKALLGGTAAAGSDFNFHVALVNPDGSHLCGAVVLDDAWVLTSSVCTFGLGTDVRVGVGSHDLAAQILFPIDEIVLPEVDDTFPAFSLLHVPTGGLTDRARVATLTTKGAFDALATPGTMGAVAGWGDDADGNAVETLQRADLPILDPAVCATLTEDAEAFCAGFIGFEAADACNDTGAAISVEHGNERVVLGLAQSSACGDAARPSLFAPTAGDVDWIRSVVPDVQVLDLDGPIPDDHGDTVDDATPVHSLIQAQMDGVLTQGDTDVFRFTIGTQQWVRIATSGAIDTLGSVLGEGGAVVASDDDSGDRFNFEIHTELAAGTYLVQVQGWGGRQEGAYTLHIEGSDDQPCDDGLGNDSPDTAVEIEDGFFWGGLAFQAREDEPEYFFVTAGVDELVYVGTTGDLDLEVLDQAGNVVMAERFGVDPSVYLPVSDAEQTWILRATGAGFDVCVEGEIFPARMACSQEADALEPADTLTGNETLGLTLVRGDEDRFDLGAVEPGAILTIELAVTGDEDTVDVEMMNDMAWSVLDIEVERRGNGEIVATYTNSSSQVVYPSLLLTLQDDAPCDVAYDLFQFGSDGTCPSDSGFGLGTATTTTVTGTTCGEGNDVATTCGNGTSGEDFVYTFEAEEAGLYVFNTDDSAYDTVLELREGCPSTVLACDDDGGEGNRSRIERFMAAGEQVQVVVDGYSGCGDFTLNVTRSE